MYLELYFVMSTLVPDDGLTYLGIDKLRTQSAFQTYNPLQNSIS